MDQPKPERPRLRKLELFRSLGYVPHRAQLLVHKSRAPRRVVACGTRFGKSLIGTFEVIAALPEPHKGMLIWLVAPTYELTSRIFKRVVDLLHEHMPHRVVRFDVRAHEIAVVNFGGGVSLLRARSADRPVSLLGDAVDALIIDEAAALREDVWAEHLAPRLIDRAGWLLLLSTPNGPGWFYDEYLRGKKDRDPAYACWRFASTENPFISKTLVEAEQARLSPDVFRAQYLAEFVGVPLIPCDVCLGPRSDSGGRPILVGDEEPSYCPACRGLVHKDGKSAVHLSPDGSTCSRTIRIQKTDPARPRPELPDLASTAAD